MTCTSHNRGETRALTRSPACPRSLVDQHPPRSIAIPSQLNRTGRDASPSGQQANGKAPAQQGQPQQQPASQQGPTLHPATSSASSSSKTSQQSGLSAQQQQYQSQQSQQQSAQYQPQQYLPAQQAPHHPSPQQGNPGSSAYAGGARAGAGFGGQREQGKGMQQAPSIVVSGDNVSGPSFPPPLSGLLSAAAVPSEHGGALAFADTHVS